MSSAARSSRSRSHRTITPFQLFAAGLLAAVWLVGGTVHAEFMIATGWGDIPPMLIPIALGLVLWSGVVAWAFLPRHGRNRSGALAGMLTFVVTVVGQFVLVVLFMDPANLAAGDETWFSLLLESWFWIGIPLVVSATLGALGWRLTQAAYGYTHPRPPHGHGPVRSAGRA